LFYWINWLAIKPFDKRIPDKTTNAGSTWLFDRQLTFPRNTTRTTL
jgi:hypothetical protein